LIRAAVPDDNSKQGLGEDGMRLHDWAFDDPSVFDRIHLANVLLGGGRLLFDLLPQRIELEQTGLGQTGGVTHLDYRVLR
jgi:hypothetical protein